jgi:cytochrome P450
VGGTFIKTDLVENIGDRDNGLLWERNPVKHREVAKGVSPAFSNNAIRAKVPTMEKHLNFMIDRMKELGSAPEGVDLRMV